MALLAPRVVVVRRETELDRIRTTHANLASARFVLERRGLSIDGIERAHAVFVETLRQVRAAVPPDWRQVTILRSDVERFQFGPEDIVLTVGQDGLVANVAKYLSGQVVVGVDPEPGRNVGILVRFPVAAVGDVLADTAAGRVRIEERVMAEARLDSGERLLALNEIFVGHRSHQSARYRLSVGDEVERQSSSGLIVCTGTGLTGWASSILRATAQSLDLPPTLPRLGYLVREAWAGPGFGTALGTGVVASSPLIAVSEMDDGGTVFADGIETDHLVFGWGRTVTVSPAEERLRLAVPA